jgi:hypothetical protein
VIENAVPPPGQTHIGIYDPGMRELKLASEHLTLLESVLKPWPLNWGSSHYRRNSLLIDQFLSTVTCA